MTLEIRPVILPRYMRELVQLLPSLKKSDLCFIIQYLMVRSDELGPEVFDLSYESSILANDIRSETGLLGQKRDTMTNDLNLLGMMQITKFWLTERSDLVIRFAWNRGLSGLTSQEITKLVEDTIEGDVLKSDDRSGSLILGAILRHSGFFNKPGYGQGKTKRGWWLRNKDDTAEICIERFNKIQGVESGLRS